MHPPVEIPVLVLCDLNPFPLLEVVDEHRLFDICHPLHFTGHGASYQGGAHSSISTKAKAGGKEKERKPQTGMHDQTGQMQDEEGVCRCVCVCRGQGQTCRTKPAEPNLQEDVRKEPVMGIG